MLVKGFNNETRQTIPYFVKPNLVINHIYSVKNNQAFCLLAAFRKGKIECSLVLYNDKTRCAGRMLI